MLTAVLDRVRAECPTFAAVEHALTSDADFSRPAALVGVSRVMATPNGLIEAHVQRFVTTVSVWLLMDRKQDGLVAYGTADLWQTLTAELRAALVAWSPDDPRFAPFDYAGGQLDRHPGGTGVAIWREDFTTEHLEAVL
jgi:hypothetical protein